MKQNLRSESHKKLEDNLAILGMRYWEYDIQTKRLYRSALIQDEVGYSAYKENVPESYIEEGIIHPSYIHAYLDFYYNLQKGIEGRLVFQSKFANGHWGWLDITYKVECDQDGKPVRAIGIGGNISRYSGIAIFKIKKQDFQIDYANDIYYEMLGDSQKTFQNIKESIQNNLQSEGQQIIEYKKTQPDGNATWYRCRYVVTPQDSDYYLVPALFTDITEQKKNFMLMEEREKQQELIINNIPLGIMVLQYDGEQYKILQVNPAICKMMQMDAKKAIGVSGDGILELTHPEDVEVVRNAAIELLNPGTNLYYEFRSLNRTTGKYTWTSANAKSVLQPDGKIFVYMGYQDITNRKEKEEEYKRRIAILADMDDKNLIAKGRHNLTKNRVIAYSQKTDYAASVVTGASYDDAVLALADRALTADKKREIIQMTSRDTLLKGFVEGNTDGMLEFCRSVPNQMSIWTMVKYSLFEEPDTHDIIAFMFSYDITERIRENRIITKISSLEYETLGFVDIQTEKYAIITALNEEKQSTADALDYYNESAIEKILYHTENYVQNDLESSAECLKNSDTIHKCSISHVREQLMDKNIFSVIYDVESMPSHKIGRKRIQFSYLDESKETILFFLSDITETYEKEQEQLQKIEQALRLANTASRAKTEFFSRMSHDMRTPMNGILGLASLSRTENDVEVLKDNIDKIYESGQYLLGLINDTLDFQRIESGKMKLEPKLSKASEIVQNIIDMVQQAASAKGVNLSVVNDNGPEDLNWYLNVDPMRIKQIFINLLSNAVKFTPKGGTVEFSIKSLKMEKNVSHDLIIVRDTGIGMSDEFIQNGIFKPFSQESNSITTQCAGSGLGLSIAKSLVELMGGHIEVESELGVGTTFSVYLQFERVTAKEMGKAEETSLLHSNSIQKNLNGKRILLVEDHPLNAEIAIRLLKRVGCIVEWKQNGQEAVECMQDEEQKQFDVILMDIRMPVMDGWEATRVIRAIKRDYTKKIPIIAMTANAYEEDIKQSIAMGMNAHISKPIDMNLLYETIWNCIVNQSTSENLSKG